MKHTRSIWDNLKRGGNQKFVSLGILRSSPVPIAPIAEQQQIAARLDELLAQVDTLKIRLDAIPKILKRFRQSVLAAAVSGKLTEDWSDVNGNFSEWQKMQLGSLIAEGPKNGLYKASSSYGNGTRILRIDNFYAGVINAWQNLKRLTVNDSDLDDFGLKVGDIIVNRVNSMSHLGKSALVRELPEPCVFESNMMRIRLDVSRILPEYCILLLTSPDGIFQLQKNAKQAVNQASINQSDVKAIIVTIPSLDEQSEIVRRAELFAAYADQIEQRVKDAQNHVNHLTQAILAKAFRGELTADWREKNPDLISGENSAEALLTKIKAEQAATKRPKL